MTTYTFQIDLPADIPVDVVSEHVGAALKRFLSDRVRVKVFAAGGTVTGPVQAFLPKIGRQHPFEGVELFDDDITAATFTVQPARPIDADYPRLTELLAHRRAATTIAEGEGDWQLENDDHVGEDTP